MSKFRLKAMRIVFFDAKGVVRSEFSFWWCLLPRSVKKTGGKSQAGPVDYTKRRPDDSPTSLQSLFGPSRIFSIPKSSQRMPPWDFKSLKTSLQAYRSGPFGLNLAGRLRVVKKPLVKVFRRWMDILLRILRFNSNICNKYNFLKFFH